MTFTSRHVTLGTAAAAIATASAKNTHELTLFNDYNHTIYVGGPDVTLSNGFELQKNIPITLKIANGDILYGVADTSPALLDLYDFQVDP